MEQCTSFLGKKLKLAATAVITAILLLSGAGCAKNVNPDVNPPVIQQADLPEWAVEDENIDLTVRTADDRGVKEVYVQFDSGDKIPLAKADSQKNGEEVTNWKASFKLPPKDYSYSIVTRDTANEARKEGNIAVYHNDADNDGIGYRDEIKYGLDPNKKNIVAQYVFEKNLGLYLPQLVRLEDDGVVDNNDKAFIDLVAEYPKAGELLPGIYGEFLLLPDLSMGKYSKIDERDIAAVEKILTLASDPQYKPTFEQILNEGVRDKRSYDAVLEALLWEAYDKDINALNGLLKDFSVEKLIKDSWRNSQTSNNYRSERWKTYEDVVARCISPRLVEQYKNDNLIYIPDPNFTTYSYHSSKQVFDSKPKGGPCYAVSSFMIRCLIENGYFDEFEKHETNTACSIGVYAFDNEGKPVTPGHTIILVKTDGQIYPIESTGDFNLIGPYKNPEDVARNMFPNWSFYIMTYDGYPTVDNIRVIGSEQFKQWMKNKSYMEKFTNTLGFYRTSEYVKMVLESYSKYNQ